MVQRGDTHYHCYGCGAHGDAIQFLMNHLKIGFGEAVESLADRFHVSLELVDKGEEKGTSKSQLKEILELAGDFFHYCLLHTEEGQEALHYLYQRGLTIDFVKRFELGWAPRTTGLLRKVLHQAHISDALLTESGLIGEKKLEFFRERITFPIRNGAGSLIGFSARKIKEETFGGKYINSPETPLFKKSRQLFGLHFSRKRIAKERRAIIVEGQIDCLKMIESGLNLTVAALGTAFGEGHVKELLQLGVREVYLLFDGDDAGKIATSKVGNLFQKVGIEVFVIMLPQNSDPDTYLKEKGIESLLEKLTHGTDYLTFQVEFLSRELNPTTPAGKTELVNRLSSQIKEWDQPVMIHESLRKIASLTQVPEEIVGVSAQVPSSPYIRKQASIALTDVDPHRILELDLLRWLILMTQEKPHFIQMAESYLMPSHFWVPICRRIFETFLLQIKQQAPTDLLSLFISLHDEEAQSCLDELLQKKINREKAEVLFKETIQKILDRQWMHEREEVKRSIHSGKHSEEEILALAKVFDDLKKNRPVVHSLS